MGLSVKQKTIDDANALLLALSGRPLDFREIRARLPAMNDNRLEYVIVFSLGKELISYTVAATNRRRTYEVTAKGMGLLPDVKTPPPIPGSTAYGWPVLPHDRWVTRIGTESA